MPFMPLPAQRMAFLPLIKNQGKKGQIAASVKA
jgi:hypothetical protein